MNIEASQARYTARAEIEALKERYRADLQLILDRLPPATVEEMDRDCIFDLDADDTAMREHLELMK